MKTTTFGVDLAKRVFQVHWVDMDTGEINRRQLKREQLVTFFAKQAPALIAMEACGSAHYWARRFASFGHQVRLIAPSFVRPFVKRNKTDVADAQAIWEAAQRPEMRFVAVKSEAQQAVLTLHRVRAQLLKMRRMQINQTHGLLYEFGAGSASRLAQHERRGPHAWRAGRRFARHGHRHASRTTAAYRSAHARHPCH
ncbi:transposase [Paraburkholderia sp. MM5477-R1]